jgi:mRNA interferase MazF
VTGVALSDQVKSLDWRARNAERICSVPGETVAAVLEKLSTLIEPTSP